MKKIWGGVTFLYSDVCFVKNKHEYVLAKYAKNQEDGHEFWCDNPSIHPLNEDDEWTLSDGPLSSLLSMSHNYVALYPDLDKICNDQNNTSDNNPEKKEKLFFIIFRKNQKKYK